MKNSTFHLSLPCRNLNETLDFYTGHFKCRLGRAYVNWADIDLYGTEITFIECGDFQFTFNNYSLNKQVLPSFHFGVVLNEKEWNNLLDDIIRTHETFYTPTEYLIDQPGHHKSFFMEDPNGYMVEVKYFEHEDDIFKTNPKLMYHGLRTNK